MPSTTCANGSCGSAITREKLLDYIQRSGGRNYPFSEQGRVLRVATAQDLAEQAKLDENRQKHLHLARELAQPGGFVRGGARADPAAERS